MNIPEYTLIYCNIPGYTWIYMNIHEYTCIQPLTETLRFRACLFKSAPTPPKKAQSALIGSFTFTQVEGRLLIFWGRIHMISLLVGGRFVKILFMILFNNNKFPTAI